MHFVETITCGPFETNAYLIGKKGSLDMLLVDAPPGSYEIVPQTLKEKARVIALLITHPHFDHVLDAGFFARDGIPLFAHSDAVFGIEKPDTLDLMPQSGDDLPAAKVTNLISDGSHLHLADLDIEVIEAPGHSPGSLAFSIPLASACFVGDVLFQKSIGRTDLPGGNFDMLAESIQTKIYTLPDDVIVYPGHGPTTTVGYEKRSNPYVRG